MTCNQHISDDVFDNAQNYYYDSRIVLRKKAKQNLIKYETIYSKSLANVISIDSTQKPHTFVDKLSFLLFINCKY